jgi:hypothetical protein
MTLVFAVAEKNSRNAVFKNTGITDLNELTTRMVNTPNEFAGAMQIPDTARVF